MGVQNGLTLIKVCLEQSNNTIKLTKTEAQTCRRTTEYIKNAPHMHSKDWKKCGLWKLFFNKPNMDA